MGYFLPKKAQFLPPLVKTKIYKIIKSLNINIITFSTIGQMGLPIYNYNCITMKWLSKCLKQNNIDLLTIIIVAMRWKRYSLRQTAEFFWLWNRLNFSFSWETSSVPNVKQRNATYAPEFFTRTQVSRFSFIFPVYLRKIHQLFFIAYLVSPLVLSQP